MRIAIIGGTGVYDPAILSDVRTRTVVTPYGLAVINTGIYNGMEVGFMARHGAGHGLPPHRVNYRANIWALREIGVERILATAAVGSCRREIAPGSMVLVDQFLDFTKARPATFFEGGEGGVVHTDMTEPYCPELRQILYDAAKELGIPARNGGVYVCTEGPRFETPAEIRMFNLLGGDVVGMTSVPEVVLARELGMCYATIAMVTNYGAGISPAPLSHQEVLDFMSANVANLRRLLLTAVGRIPAERHCHCALSS